MKRIFKILFFVNCLPAVFLVGLLLTANCFAQPFLEWVESYGNSYGPAYESGIGIDRFGNVYVTGKCGTGTERKINATVKYNATGQQQWTAIYIDTLTTDLDNCFLAADGAGNVYVTCNTWINFTPAYYVLMKYNTNGELQWLNRYDYVNMGYAGYLTFDKYGYIYVSSTDDSSGIIAKYNSSGDSIWVRKYHETYNGNTGYIDQIGKIVINDSNLYSAGFSEEIITWPPGNPPYYNYLTIKYDLSGKPKWGVKYAAPGEQYPFDACNDITYDRYGNVIVTGSINNNANSSTVKYNSSGIQQWAVINNNVATYAVIADTIGNIYTASSAAGSSGGHFLTKKYDPFGDTLWTRMYQRSGTSDGAYCVKLDKSQDVYVSGIATDGSNNNSFITVKYTSTGQLLWETDHPGTLFNQWNTSLIVDTNNDFFLGGAANSDYDVLKYSEPNGIISHTNISPNKFELYQNYPNPFNPYTIISYLLPKKTQVKLCVYNVLGQLVKSFVSEQSAGRHAIVFNGNNFASGTYFYSLFANNSKIDTKKFVLLK